MSYIKNEALRTILFLLILFFWQHANTQILINEVCSDNESIIQDQEGDYEDWIEIYNAGNSSINLNNYYLSDDPQDPQKWTFPDIEILPQGFLLIFASDKNLSGTELHTNFKISKDGETLIFSNTLGEPVDLLMVPALLEDESIGRTQDGESDFNFFYEPSPGFTNNGSMSYDFADQPEFENTHYFYDEATAVSLNCDQADCQIYFTTDGSVPDENSNLYTGPITLDTSTTIRAAAITPTLFLSTPVTRTFFIDTEHEIPVIALTTSPEYLWDFENGIFVDGPNADTVWPYFGANFWKDIEIPIHFEYFENEELEVEYPLGAKVHGGKGARTKPMKPIRLLAKRSYGTEIMDYPFFNNRTNSKFERLVLRNASGDFNICHMRDEFLSRYFIDENLHMDAVAEQPVVVYINGSCQGVMHLREKIDRFYLQHNFGADPDEIDLLEEDTANIEGNFNIFNENEFFVLNNDLSIPSNYQIAASYFDLENLSDYFIAQTYVNNTDWPHNNLKYWRSKTDTAKWRYILFDMDISTAHQGFNSASANSFGSKILLDSIRMVGILRAFLENESFKNYFINRYADLTNSSFREENLVAEVIRSRDEIDEEMKTHLPKWGKTYDRWYDVQMPKLIKFANERPAYARQFVMEYFDLASEDQIEISTYPENNADIKINSISIGKESLPWDGHYFNDIPIEISVDPEQEEEFSHWEIISNNQLITSLDYPLVIHPSEGDQIKAIFNSQIGESDFEITPNPTAEKLNIQLTSFGLSEVQIKIFDTKGSLALPVFNSVSSTGINTFEIDLLRLQNGMYFVQIVGDDISLTKPFIKMGR